MRSFCPDNGAEGGRNRKISLTRFKFSAPHHTYFANGGEPQPPHRSCGPLRDKAGGNEWTDLSNGSSHESPTPRPGEPAVVPLATPLVPSQDALLADIEAHLAEGRGFTVATVNLDHLVKLRRDPAFRDAYARHSHVVADGNPIVWLQRLAGRPVELVPGSDLITPLMALAARTGTPVAFLGSSDAVLDAAAERLRATHPGLDVVVQLAPPYGYDPTGDLADSHFDQIERSGARLCLLALGAPKQEILAARARERLPGCGFVSIGAGLDFIAGTQRRAPLWARRMAMEWAWRMLGDWRRLAGRYRDCALILPGLTVTALRERRRGR